MKILVTEKIADDGIKHLQDRGYEVDVMLGMKAEELYTKIGIYEGLIVRSVTQVNENLLLHAGNLKVVGRAGNGIDNIDVEACSTKGIIVVNTPEGNIMAAAELAVGLAFALFRNIPQVWYSCKFKDDFRRGKFIGNELEGKTAGIIGLGRIGSIVARKLKGINMNVCAYDPYIPEEVFEKNGVDYCATLEELLKKSDLVTIHTPKTDETYNMIGEKELALCKKGVRMVNAARGGLYNEDALYEALKSGHVAGAGIDVLEPEPSYDAKPGEQGYKHKLLELDNCIITPHLGASTMEANYNVGVEVAKLVSDALEGQIVAAVNMPPVKAKDMSKFKPYFELAEVLGRIYYQAEKAKVNKIEITYSGDLASEDTEVLTLPVLKGFLEPIMKERVNYVNAPKLLQSMAITVVEGKGRQLEKYTNLITVKFYNSEKVLSVSGTIFAKEEVRIVDFFGYKLDFEPSPYVLAIQNMDRPGIIGKIGTILGENNINIAAMQWSRNRKGEKAVAFVSIDGSIDNTISDRLKEIDGVLRVSMLRF